MSLGVATVKALRWHPLLDLASILEDDSTARVYFRASGGLARLAGATATAGRCCWGDYSASSADCEVKSETRASTAAIKDVGRAFGGGGGARDARAATDQLEEERATFASMLTAVSAALKGGERLAQHEVSKSGLLGAPCAQAMRAVLDGVWGDAAATGTAGTAAATTAGAAAMLLSRVVDDESVRAHVAR